MAAEFKLNVETYIQVLREEKAQAKLLSDIRQQKRKLNDRLKQYMTHMEYDKASVTDMATVRMVQKRRFLGLKRENIESWAREVFGSDRSLQEVDKLYDTREIKTSEELVVKPTT